MFHLLHLLVHSVIVHVTFSGHSLRYYHTAASAPRLGLPQYSSVGYVDGIQITKYTSDTGRTVPVALWMNRLGADYWEQETEISKGAEVIQTHNVRIAMSRYNQTAGFHTFQAMYGCELRDDGSTRGYWQYSYDGKGFLALDMQHGIYIPLTDQAQLSAYRWNSPEVQGVERAKYYLQTECIEWLKKYIEHGKEELDRRNPPQVIILSQQSYGFTKLHCQVYGFYPQDIDVTWKRNGIEIPLDEAKQILPNTDGTYQIRITVKVPAREKEGYACYVVHSSLTETLTVKWDPITDIHPAFKIATLTAALVVVIIVCIVIILVCLGQLRVQAPNLY